ncbi:MAG: DUF1194 domain-containing protein [Sulfitobacter sp.]
MIRLLLIVAAVWSASLSVVYANCRQALVLALDVSGSVDLREYRLQLDGLVAALSDTEVREALLAFPAAPVSLMVFEWSGADDQAVLVPWTAISNADVLAQVIATLSATSRRQASPGTALGDAMRLGAQYLNQKPACWKRTLDISGDGKSNLGPRPRDVKDAISGLGFTINALVIGADTPTIADLRQVEIGELSSYFQAEVIAGPDAFVLTALGFEDYGRAMTAKLLRELDGVVIGSLQ